MSAIITVVGWICCGLTTLQNVYGFGRQLLLLRTAKPEGIAQFSLQTFVLLTAAQVGWTLFGFMTASPVLVVPNAIGAVICAGIVYKIARIRNGGRK